MYIYMCIYIYIYVYMCIYIFIFVHLFIHYIDCRIYLMIDFKRSTYSFIGYCIYLSICFKRSTLFVFNFSELFTIFQSFHCHTRSFP